jgi:hypothetical protein
MLCDGFSQEDMLAHDAAIIEEHGYLVTGVGGGEPPHWAYTVGLLDLFGHPELIVAGPHFEDAGALINAIGRSIREGRRFDVGDTWTSPPGTVRFGAVHPIQYRLGTFNVWFALEQRGYLQSTELEAIQAVAPTGSFCGCALCAQPDLSRPESRVGVAPLSLNRSARRTRPR